MYNKKIMNIILLLLLFSPIYTSVGNFTFYAKEISTHTNNADNMQKSVENDLSTEENHITTKSNDAKQIKTSADSDIKQNSPPDSENQSFTEIADGVYTLSDEERNKMNELNNTNISINTNQELDLSFLTMEKGVGTTYNVKFIDSGHDISEVHNTHYGQMGYFIIDGEIAFCVDPLSSFGSTAIETNPNSGYWKKLGTLKQKQIQRYGTVGKNIYYETNNKNYLFATQILIWNVATGGYNLNGLYASEIDKVQEEYNNYVKVPSFTDSASKAPTHTLQYNTSNGRYEKVLTDTNGVLDKNFSSIFGTTSGDYHFDNGAGSNTLYIWTTNHNAKQTNDIELSNSIKAGITRIFEAPQTIYSGNADPTWGYMNVKIQPALGNVKVVKEITNVNGVSTPTDCSLFEVSGKGAQTLSPKRMSLVDGKCTAQWNNVLMGNYTVTEKNFSTNHEIVTATATGKLNPATTLTLKVKNEVIDGRISLNKVGRYDLFYPLEHNVPLEGAEFTIKNSKDEVVQTLITDQSGNATSKWLPAGTYTVKETKAPTGYLINGNTYTVKIDASTNHETQKINYGESVVNQNIIGDAYLQKVGESPINGNDELIGLEGAEFTIYDKFHNTVRTVISDEDGFVYTGDLVYGDYEICETKAPPGYEIFGDTFINTYCEEFSITKNGVTIELEGHVNGLVYNPIIHGGITLNKDGETLDPFEDQTVSLEGTEFTIYDESDNFVKKIITDKDGYAEAEHLKGGSYYIKETKATNGYVNLNYYEEFEITYDGQIVDINSGEEIMNDPIKGQVELTKIAENLNNLDPNMYPLKGAEFSIYVDYNGNGKIDSEDKKYETIVTDENGYAISSKLKFGNYIIKETKAPEGYLIEPVYQEAFKITTDGEVLPLNTGESIQNEEIRGAVEVNKIGENLNPHKNNNVNLKGTEFTIYDIDGYKTDQVVGKIVTDENGYGKFNNLKYGKYKIVETKPSEGYVNSGFSEEFFIKDDGVTVTVNNDEPVYNKAIRGQVELTKIAENLNNLDPDLYPLEGAEFAIFPDYNANGIIDAEDIKFETIVTDENGYAISSKLKFGNYIIKETKAPTGYLIEPLYQEAFKITTDGEVLPLNTGESIQNEEIRGAVEINKIGENLDPHKNNNVNLKGTEFTIYDIDGYKTDQVVGKIVTDENGYGKLNNLKYGKYKIVETKPSEGYVNSGFSEEFFIKDDGVTVTVNGDKPVYNKAIRGQVELTKIAENLNNLDPDLYPLEGAEFTIFPDYNANGIIDAEDIKFETIVTDENGYAISSKLKFGNYIIKETKAPEGYLIEPVYQEAFKITTDGEVIALNTGESIQNEEIRGAVEINKIGENLDPHKNSNVNLEGTEFTIYDIDGYKTDQVVGKIVTDENGYGKFNNLKYGKYKIVETKPSEGYVNSGFSEEFFIKDDGVTVTVNDDKPVYNRAIRGQVELTKIAESFNNFDDDMYPLKGAEFTVFPDYNANGLLDPEDIELETIVTDEDGYAISSPLKYGNYIIRETKAPEGYLIEPLFQESFTITTDGQIIHLNNGNAIENDIIKGKADLVKIATSHDGNYTLEGARFDVYQDDNKNGIIDNNEQIADTIITNANGYGITKDLKYNHYVIKETMAPNGYVNSNYQEAFIIDQNNEVVHINNSNDIENTRIENYFELKKDDQYHDSVQGAEFTVYKPVVTEGDTPTVNPITGKEDIITFDGNDIPVIEVEKLYTDENGYAKSSWLGEGTYYIKETKAPQGYVLEDTVQKFQVTEENFMNKIIYTYHFENEIIDNYFEINKKSQYDKNLAGVEFTVYEPIVKTNQNYPVVTPTNGEEILLNVNGEEIPVLEVETLTTDIDGYARSKLYTEGTYYIKETKGLEGYLVDETVQKFQVTEENRNDQFTYNIVNERIENEIHIRKTDLATGKEIEGAKLQILDTDGNIVDKWTSTTNEHVTTIEYGKYTICETAAPKGYKRLSECVKFEVTEDGINQYFKIDNELIPELIITGKTQKIVTLILIFTGMVTFGLYLNKKKF